MSVAKRLPPAKRVVKAKLIEIEVKASDSLGMGILGELIHLAAMGHDAAKITFAGSVGTLKVTR